MTDQNDVIVVNDEDVQDVEDDVEEVEEDIEDVDDVEEAEERNNTTPWWVWILLLLLIGLIVGGIFLFREIRQNVVANQDPETVTETQNGGDDPVVIPTIRIPGRGSQLDYSHGLPYARVNVHDDEAPNENGYFDRTVINSDNPTDIGMGDSFAVPEDWTVERDYSLANSAFVDYITVKPPVDTTAEQIRSWADDNDFDEGISFEITSVIVVDGQECSITGLDVNRVRTNVYVGENWFYQACEIN